MASETSSSAKYSFFDEYITLLTRQPTNLDDPLKSLVAAAMTISKFRVLLFAKDVDFATGFVLSYVENTMKEDFNRVIAILSDYRGDDRRGVKEAYELMKSAERCLYRIMTSLRDEMRKDSIKNTDIRVAAFQECRENLKNAYLQLEHLVKYFPSNPPGATK